MSRCTKTIPQCMSRANNPATCSCPREKPSSNSALTLMVDGLLDRVLRLENEVAALKRGVRSGDEK